MSTRKGGGYYGYKVHVSVCVGDRPPGGVDGRDASAAETTFALSLIDATEDWIGCGSMPT